MRKLICLLVLLASLTSSRSQVKFGGTAGVNLAKMNFDNDNYATHSQTGFFTGLTAVYPLSSSLNIHADLVYSAEGSKEKSTIATASGNIKESFVCLPVLLAAKMGSAFFIEAGPQFNFLISIKEKFGNATSYNDIKEYYNPIDFRLCGGAGYYLSTILAGLGVQARYSFSLTHFNKSEIAGTSVKNQVGSIGVFYLFPREK